MNALHPLALAAVSFATGFAAATPPDYGIDWVVIGDVGNPAYNRQDPHGHTAGRGSVDYAYRMGRLEITTGQWLEFANAMGALGDPFRIGDGPNFWGAQRDFSAPPGTRRYFLRPEVPNAATLPVIGISWFNAARYCNWLHNGKALSLDALVTGAYDSTSWQIDPDTGRPVADERRLPGAKFWIPSRDEWLKAAHYDPTKNGTGGWWLSPNQTDQPMIYDTVANGGTSNAFFRIATDPSVHGLGLYPDQQSYYGLLDLSGGACEWNEGFSSDPAFNQSSRFVDGTSTYYYFMTDAVDQVYSVTTRFASVETSVGFRIASAIPGPVCDADLSGSSDPNNFAYGVPDGNLDSADFFYFLDQFVGGNVEIADLSGSSDPNDPDYGTPDGFLDASDFFYYLDQFVLGCP